jgi:hypothetical protein
MFNDRRRHATLPYIPTPAHKEQPVVEELVKEPHHDEHRDTRPLMKQEAIIHEPRYNHLYGSDRVEGSWRYRIDEYVTGNLTTSANAQVNAVVTLANDPYWRLSRWPGARQLFLCMRMFGLCPRTTLTTAGSLVCTFQDATLGKSIPLGVFPSTAGGNDYLEVLLGTISDPDALTLGTIEVTLSGTSPTTGTYDWQVGVSVAYLLPELRGYERAYHEIRGENERIASHHL